MRCFSSVRFELLGVVAIRVTLLIVLEFSATESLAQVDDADSLPTVRTGNSSSVLETVRKWGFEAEIIERRNEILVRASQDGDMASASLALELGADAKAKGPSSWTAIMSAAFGGHDELVRLLARNGGLAGQDEQLHVADDEMNVVLAALLGAQGKSFQRAARVLVALKEERPGILASGVARYREYAESLGYDKEFIAKYLPLERLPPLDYRLPSPLPEGVDGWEKVQRILKEEGLYDGVIDGRYNLDTALGMLAYIDGLEAALFNRCYEAYTRALKHRGNGQVFGGFSAFAHSLDGQDGAYRLVAGEGDIRRSDDKDKFLLNGAGYYMVVDFRPGDGYSISCRSSYPIKLEIQIDVDSIWAQRSMSFVRNVYYREKDGGHEIRKSKPDGSVYFFDRLPGMNLETSAGTSVDANLFGNDGDDRHIKLRVGDYRTLVGVVDLTEISDAAVQRDP